VFISFTYHDRTPRGTDLLLAFLHATLHERVRCGYLADFGRHISPMDYDYVYHCQSRRCTGVGLVLDWSDGSCRYCLLWHGIQRPRRHSFLKKIFSKKYAGIPAYFFIIIICLIVFAIKGYNKKNEFL